MVQGRVQLPHAAQVVDVPHVDAVVGVDAGQLRGGGVGAQSQGVGVLGSRREAAVGQQDAQSCSMGRAAACLLCSALPVLRCAQVHAQPVRPRQRGHVLQVGRAEDSDHALGAAAEDEVLAGHQAARRRRLAVRPALVKACGGPATCTAVRARAHARALTDLEVDPGLQLPAAVEQTQKT